MAVDLVEEEPERELLEPEEEELGLTRWALGASASSLQSNRQQGSDTMGTLKTINQTELLQ